MLSQNYRLPIVLERLPSKNKNKDGSFDLGVMQINSKTFNAIKNEYPTLTESDLINHPCLNIYFGAMILTRNFALYGKNWLAVGMYNAGMRIKFTGRWNKQNLKKAICESIEESQFYDIEFLSGVNLYFHGENINFDKIEIRNENDAPVMFIYDNNIPAIKPREKKKKKSPRH